MMSMARLMVQLNRCKLQKLQLAYNDTAFEVTAVEEEKYLDDVEEFELADIIEVLAGQANEWFNSNDILRKSTFYVENSISTTIQSRQLEKVSLL